jgi:ABC-type phosphate transport system permease subunit
MKRAAAVLLAVCAGALGEDAPATMTTLMVKLESPEIPKDSFAAEAKRMYRAGSRHCRIEENLTLNTEFMVC